MLTRSVIADQSMQSMADAVRFIPGVTMAQGEGHRDAPVIRGQSTTADFFVDGVRDDAQYLRDLYNVERIEALKGSNAMIFGRGGGAASSIRCGAKRHGRRVGSLTLEGGSFDHKRGTLDVGGPLGEHVAARLDGVYENSRGFRDASRLAAPRRHADGDDRRRRHHRPPRLRVLPRRPHRRPRHPVVPRRASPAPITTFFGDPAVSRSRADVNGGAVVLDRALGRGISLRNRTRAMHYDKFYQNVYPGAVDTQRHAGEPPRLQQRHGAQRTCSTRPTSPARSRRAPCATRCSPARSSRASARTTCATPPTSTAARRDDAPPFHSPSPTNRVNVAFRQSSTDADNHVRADVGALYAQDQIALSPQWQAIAGVRVDAFTVRFHNNRNGQDLERYDRLVSPRAGLIFKPVNAASLYASYSVSHLPSSGDQFSSLTATTQTLEPEQFRNYEVGAKWDVRESLALTAALFQLDRSNSTAPDPANPQRTVQTGAQRTTGYELGATGEVTSAWQLVAGYSSQMRAHPEPHGGRRRGGHACRSSRDPPSRCGTACSSRESSALERARCTRRACTPRSTTASRFRRSRATMAHCSSHCPSRRARS